MTIRDRPMKRELLTLYVYYYEDENIFTDEIGKVIYNIFNIITPNDVFLFKHDPANNCFPMVSDRSIEVMILSIPSELRWLEDVPFIDLGDDYERIGRWEQAYQEGCYGF